MARHTDEILCAPGTGVTEARVHGTAEDADGETAAGPTGCGNTVSRGTGPKERKRSARRCTRYLSRRHRGGFRGRLRGGGCHGQLSTDSGHSARKGAAHGT